jgi:zinc resistance-associated protein
MKTILQLATIALIAGAAITFPADARERDRGPRADRPALTVNQLVAGEDARTARLKADLRLTAEQEPAWPALETALRQMGNTRAERQVRMSAEREPKESDDFVARLNTRATFLSERSAYLKKLADAIQPLYTSLDERQKRKLANHFARPNEGVEE